MMDCRGGEGGPGWGGGKWYQRSVPAAGQLSVPFTDGTHQGRAGLRQWPEGKRDPLLLPGSRLEKATSFPKTTVPLEQFN